LLRRFEPIIRFDRGERFFPMDAGRYVEQCSFWAKTADGSARPLYSRGELTLDRLPQVSGDDPNATLYLRLEPLAGVAGPPQGGAADRARRGIRPAGRRRLARVGYPQRLADAVYAIALLTRDPVPRGRAAAAAAEYERVVAEGADSCYYGRIAQQNGWLVLQYWLFYLFDDWRSGFAGANDHDADWELVAVYLAKTPEGDWRPEWVAASCHDDAGALVVRPWTDPELARQDDHPIIWAGAGSHASYFAPGEYLSEIELPFLRPLSHAIDAWRAFWHGPLRQYRRSSAAPPGELARFCAPFFDYARGDGLAIGPGQVWSWGEPRLIDPPPAWVSRYRGLWGWYSRDPFATESAPAGPMYNRDGTPRRSWYDPVGWAGLDRTLPRAQALNLAEERLASDDELRDALAGQLEDRERELRRLTVELAATEGQRHLRQLRAALEARAADLSREATRLRIEAVTAEARRQATEDYVNRLKSGEAAPAGLAPRRPRYQESAERHAHRLADVWAAVSVGLLLMGIVGLDLFAGPRLVPGLVLLVAAVAFVEAVLYGGLTRLVGNLAVGLALAAAAVLAYTFFWWLIGGAGLLIGGYVVWGNLRELRNQ
jgi:hypothetical protein